METKRIMMIRPGQRFPRNGFGEPLGLLSLIAVLREGFPGRFEIDLVEQALYDLGYSAMRKRITAFAPDLVCFSCLSVEANVMRDMARLCRELRPDAPIWLGGPHASVFFDLELEAGVVDAVCIGEGEATFGDMITAWLEGRPLDDVPGLALCRDGKAVLTPAREPIADLDALPLPAWDMIDFHQYAREPSMNAYVKRMPWAMLFTSRACPYQCIYCHGIFGKKVRRRSVESVMAELELLVHTYGVREVHIVDDIFNLDLPRAKQICDEIVRRGLNISIAFPNGLRGDRMDRELVHKLKAAGCYCITYALETASPRMQKLIKKNVDLDKLKETIEYTAAEGIIVQAFVMLGFPGETPEEMRMTIDYTLDSKLLRAWYFTVVVYPRTGLYDLAREQYPDFDFAGYDMFNLRYWAERPFYAQVTGIDVYAIQRDAYRAFYLRPRTIAKIVLTFPKNRWFLIGLYWGARAVFTQIADLQFKFLPLQRRLTRALNALLHRSPPDPGKPNAVPR
jgi:anaerobic magnesium-protoporphyrin IX monomethyl ester cyclase